MNLIKIFHSVKATPETEIRIAQQYEVIRNIIAEKSGCSKYIQLPDEKGGGIAFSGTTDSPDLILEIYLQYYDKKPQLYFNLFICGDEVSWQEWDFESIDLCIEQVTSQISSLMNHTVKLIKKQKRHSYLHITEQILDNSGNWQTITDDYLDHKLIKLLLLKNIDEEKTVTFSFA